MGLANKRKSLPAKGMLNSPPAAWFPDETVSQVMAVLLADSSGRALFATQLPGANVLDVGRVVGQDWRELFAEFEEVVIESQGEPDTFFFVSADGEGEAYRARRWNALSIPGAAGGAFIVVEAVGDPAAVRELIYRERMVALGQIATGVAHEINNPLTTVSGWLQILLSETGENEKRRAPLQLMTSEATRIAGIVHHLLSFGRRAPSEQQLVRVNRLVADVLALIEYQMRNDNVRVEKRLASNLPLVLGDANQLKQVFLNIVVNAREAMRGGGSLAIASRAVDGALEVSFSDTGCGIAPDVVEHIFDPFYTTKGDRGGSGLGLFLCRNIVRDHNGALTVSSRPGEGSTFIVRLPAARAEETTANGSGLDWLGVPGTASGDAADAPSAT